MNIGDTKMALGYILSIYLPYVYKLGEKMFLKKFTKIERFRSLTIILIIKNVQYFQQYVFLTF